MQCLHWENVAYCITACISQGLVSLCLSMSASYMSCLQETVGILFVFAYLLGFLSFIHKFVRRSFLFEAVRRQSPHNAQATGRARCAQNGTRTQRPHKHKTRCSIPPGASLSWRCPVPSLIGLAYIQRQRPDSSTAQTCHSALIWPAYIHRAIPDSSTALSEKWQPSVPARDMHDCCEMTCMIAVSTVESRGVTDCRKHDRNIRPSAPRTATSHSPWPTPEANQLHAKAILHDSMYLAGSSLSLSLHVCVLPIVVQEAAHLVGYAYLPGSIFCIHRIHTPFIPFCKGCANAPRQATGRALCAPKMARAHNARTTPKTRCRIPPGDT